MLSPEAIEQIAEELAEADRAHSVVPRITARYPDATIEDSYAIQGIWRDKNLAAGRKLVGRKIGLTSKAMQQATGITEPDYGVMFDDTVYPTGSEIAFDEFSNVRIEVELAFVLKEPLEGPDCTLDDALAAIDYAVPALEVLNSHIELEGRTIVDTISDNAAYGAMVLGDVHMRPDEIDLRWVPGVLSRNGEIEETGVAAGVLGHPATGVAWLANKFHQHGARLEAGEIILAGSVHPPDVGAQGRRGALRLPRDGSHRMPFRVEPAPSFRDRLAAVDRPLAGAWICSGSPIAAEIVAGSGLDWTLIDAEHSPIGLESILALLQAVAPYPITPVVRVPSADATLIKQVLDVGAQNLLVPMVNTAEVPAAAVAATRYPPRGIRGVGSALARAGQFNRIENYLQRAHEITSLSVQIETDAAVQNARAIAEVDGVDAVFVAPAGPRGIDGTAGSAGAPRCRRRRRARHCRGAGRWQARRRQRTFNPDTARRYLDAGATFVLVAADVSILARATEKLAADWIPDADATERAGY